MHTLKVTFKDAAEVVTTFTIKAQETDLAAEDSEETTDVKVTSIDGKAIAFGAVSVAAIGLSVVVVLKKKEKAS